MSEGRPTGTVTFLFTDIEASTRQWEQDPEAMGRAVATHDALLSELIERHDGYLFSEQGDGVAAAFSTVSDAVATAVAAQQALRSEDWPDPIDVSCRMGVHTGVADERGGDYFGPPVNQAARICDAGHGGQVLVSSTSADLLDGGWTLHELGRHHLPDLSEAVTLWQVVIDDDAGAYPPLRTVDGGEEDLPSFRTALHGREEELAELTDQLERWQVVTLSGPGGVGKTRLAVETGRSLRGRYGRLVFVDLSPLDDESAVPAEIARVAGLPVDEGPSGQIDKLVRSWRNRELLLLLDNCEHLVDGVAECVDRVTAGCPGVDVLATSREALAIEGERVYRVRSLPLDTAVELFLERARAVRPDLSVDDTDRSRIQEICRHLDGLPLAIELAAARVAHLGLTQIASHLDERFELLTTSRRRTRRRQRTLEATVAWSYDLLDEPQRELLRATGVFAGGFDLEAAAAIWSREELQTLDALGSLVDKSLIRLDSAPGVTERYSLLETIRIYASQRLVAEGEYEDRRRGHARHFLARAERRPPVIEDLSPFAQHAESDPDLDNYLAALAWFEEQGDLVAVGRLTGRLTTMIAPGRFIDLSGDHLERDDVAAALADPAERALYLLASSMNANYVGRFEGWLRFADRAFAIAEDPATRGAAGAHLALALGPYEPERVPGVVAEAVEGLPEHAENIQWLLRQAPAAALVMMGQLEEALDEHESTGRAGDVTAATEAMLLRHVLRDEEPAADLPGPQAGDPRFAVWSYRTPLVRALDAAAQIDEEAGAEQRAVEGLHEAARAIESYPARLLEHDVLLGCAVLAYHRGEPRRASELLAVAGPMLRTPASFAVYVHYRDLIKDQLDPDERKRIIEQWSDRSASQVLDEELERLGNVGGADTPSSDRTGGAAPRP